MIRRAHTGLATLSFLLIWAVPIQAQVSPALEDVGPSRTVDVRGTGVASRTEVAPILDGSLDEPAWQQAAPFGGFTQAEPLAGQLASEDTEVRVLYDDDFIYVGVINYDSRPDQLLVTDSRRDANLGDADSFQMIFDTYLDRQNGFMFGTNPAGTQYDAQVRNEGSGRGRRWWWGGGGVRWQCAEGFGRRDQHELGLELGRAGQHHRHRLDRRVPNPSPHLPLWTAAPTLGRELPAQPPTESRAGLLVSRGPTV